MEKMPTGGSAGEAVDEHLREGTGTTTESEPPETSANASQDQESGSHDTTYKGTDKYTVTVERKDTGNALRISRPDAFLPDATVTVARIRFSPAQWKKFITDEYAKLGKG